MTTKTTAIAPVRSGTVSREASTAGRLPEVGDWFWVALTDDYYRKNYGDRLLSCVTHVGSNYVELTSVAVSLVTRVHFDKLADEIVPEPNAAEICARNVKSYRRDVARLLDRVKEITAGLGVAPLGIGAGNETEALAVRTSGTPVAEYKAALARAEKEQLPALFEEIRAANKEIGKWLAADLIPMEARAKALEPAIAAIKQRIFSVELYAGLVEEIVQIADGDPAASDEPVRLFQRRAYMDEECLARYEAGGMEFGDLGAFDRWIARPENLSRILPFPRAIVAFRVRRNEKERHFTSLRDYVKFALSDVKNADLVTFLYLRNGARLYRLQTAIDFGEQLFPDLTANELSGTLYGYRFTNFEKLVTEQQYLAKLAEERERNEAWERETAAEKKKPKRKRIWTGFAPGYDVARQHVRWSPDSVYYDDIAKLVNNQIAAHNRIVMVLQGIIDRSPVFHPHPPSWRLWTPEGFEAALRLVYDDSRTIASGAAPDFEVYRARLNAALRVGSRTVGQEDFWLRAEAAKENARRRRNDYRQTHEWELTTYRPTGNPGPGRVAPVVGFGKKRGATFAWSRPKTTGRKVWVENKKRPGYGHYDRVYDETESRLVVPTSSLLNVDAYTPGDYRLFYDDPRTRAEYVKWAPLLLEAENEAGKPRERRDFTGHLAGCSYLSDGHSCDCRDEKEEDDA